MITGSSVAELIETGNPAIMDIDRPKESLDEFFEMDCNVYSERNNRKKKKKIDIPPNGHPRDILNGVIRFSSETERVSEMTSHRTYHRT